MITTTILLIHLFLLLMIVLTCSYAYMKESHFSIEKKVNLIATLAGLSSLGFIISSYIDLFIGNDQNFYLVKYLNITIENTTFYLITSFLVGVIAKFSFTYLHQDRSYHKFFMNLSMFWFGLFLFIYSKSFIGLFAGWEFVGISSIFLIGYYSERRATIYSSLYIVSFYKFADMLLLFALVFMHQNYDLHSAHSDIGQFVLPAIVIAGLIKSASFPFTSWLPRSMEGPTPSSAVFYVALSVNAGVLLIIKYIDQIRSDELSYWILLISSIFTVIYSGIQARVQNDSKAMLAYSSSSQIGIIFIELLFGFKELAYIHLLGNITLKTYQFLRTPSSLHDFHELEGYYKESVLSRGIYLEKILPNKLRSFLYYISLNHFYIDGLFLWPSVLIKKLGANIKLVLYPIVESKDEKSYKLVSWFFLYVIFVLFDIYGVFNVNEKFFDFLPLCLILVTFGMLFESHLSAFIGMFSVYKVLEHILIYSSGINLELQWLLIVLSGLFVFALIRFEKRLPSSSKLVESFIIILLLVFTNFPFLVQSTLNEHIIEFFVSKEFNYDLLTYGIANTLFNIAMFRFVFYKIYITRGIDG